MDEDAETDFRRSLDWYVPVMIPRVVFVGRLTLVSASLSKSAHDIESDPAKEGKAK